MKLLSNQESIQSLQTEIKELKLINEELLLSMDKVMQINIDLHNKITYLTESPFVTLKKQVNKVLQSNKLENALTRMTVTIAMLLTATIVSIFWVLLDKLGISTTFLEKIWK